MVHTIFDIASFTFRRVPDPLVAHITRAAYVTSRTRRPEKVVVFSVVLKISGGMFELSGVSVR